MEKILYINEGDNMSISGLNQFNAKKILRQPNNLSAASDEKNSLWAAFASGINSEMVKNQLLSGLSEDSVLSQLLMLSGVDKQDTDTLDMITQEYTELIETVQKEIEQESSETATDNTQNTPENTEGWNIEDTGNIFDENITRENFLQNLDSLNKTTNEENYFSQYLNAINEVGGENFFNTLDENSDGILDKTELGTLINSDEYGAAISMEEFNNLINRIQTDQEGMPTVPESDDTQPVTPAPVSEPDKPEKTSDKKSHHSSSSDSGSTDVQQDDKPQKETVDELMKQKQQVISDADSKIKDLNNQIDTLINESTADEQLKTNYKNAKEAYNANETSISDNNTKIENYNKDIHDIDTSLAALEGELSTIDTNTDNAEINKKNTERKAEINSQITEFNNKKKKLEEEKQAIEQTNSNLKTKSGELQTSVDNAYTALQAVLSDDVKQKISELKSQITTTETEKNSKVQELDSKIETLKTQEINDSRQAGETTGKMASNPVGSKFVEDALKYLGMKGGSLFSTGDYGWCADFVSYVVKEVARSMGKSKEEVKDLGRNHLGASPQKLVKKNKSNVIEVAGKSTQELANSIQPGMAFICKGGGASGQHTGFVAEVYSDGTFLSIEGNHGNKVCQVRRNISDMYRYVDFSYLFA